MINQERMDCPQVIEEIKMSSISIVIPLEARIPQKLPTIMEDPNIVGAKLDSQLHSNLEKIARYMSNDVLPGSDIVGCQPLYSLEMQGNV